MRTVLTLEEMARALAPLGLKPRSLAPLAKGTVNSNFRVETDGGAVFVRVNEGKREEDVAYEGALLWQLALHRFPTPQPLRTSAGRPWLADEGRLLTVFPWQPGEEVGEGAITAAHAGRIGELLARLHLAARAFPRHRRGIYTFERIGARVDGFRERARGLLELREVVPLLDEEIGWQRSQRAAGGELPVGTIHGDVFPDNLLWLGDRIVALLDFEQASRGRLVYDLSVALLANCWREGALVDGLAWSMVSGYQRVRALSEAEREALWVEARLAALRFTVTRITDLYLPSLEPNPPPARAGKDFRDFLARLVWLRARGADALLPIIGERPPLRAV